MMSMLVSADSEWTAPPSSSLWSEGLLGDIYYSAGDVGIGDSTPDGILDLIATGTHTELVIDSPSGTYDSSIEFRNSGTLEWQICVDDSVLGDELDFIRGGSSCSSQDTMTLTAEGLEMGRGSLYFDASTSWSGSSPSSRYNNQFTIRNFVATSINTINYGVNGQFIYIICNDAVSIFVDSAGGGNLQLSGNFNCGVGDTLHLIYNDVLRDWVEISRSNN